jgi:DNA-binding PadR family transcriptional regulator
MPDKPWKPRRRDRRVLLVLLTGAPNLSGYVICRAAGLASGTVHPCLARLESMGWADSEWRPGPEPRRRVYRLTKRGRYHGMLALGLEIGDE